jgi:hypothetical protein
MALPTRRIQASPPPNESELRNTGIGMVGDVPWGSHFFLFYETKDDLLDTLVPYFRPVWSPANSACGPLPSL